MTPSSRTSRREVTVIAPVAEDAERQPLDHMRVGLCGWTVSMPAYVAKFDVVEVQHTFYEPPSDSLLARWRNRVPPGFEFTMKAWQMVTHESRSPTYRRLKQPLPEALHGQVGGFRMTPPVLDAWARTLECARVLNARAVLLQCPRSFTPTDDNVSRMRTFVGTVERPEGLLLWEPRGAWPSSLVAYLCADLGLVHVVDPMQGETMTPEHTYYRLHGTTGMRHVHTDGELRKVRDLVRGRPSPYVMFNNLGRAADASRFLLLE